MAANGQTQVVTNEKTEITVEFRESQQAVNAFMAVVEAMSPAFCFPRNEGVKRGEITVVRILRKKTLVEKLTLHDNLFNLRIQEELHEAEAKTEEHLQQL